MNGRKANESSQRRFVILLAAIGFSAILLSGCAQLNGLVNGNTSGNVASPPANQAAVNVNSGNIAATNANTNATTKVDDGAVFETKADLKECEVESGWKTCKEMPSPSIKIFASRLVSESAINGVANTYHQLTKRFSDKYPKDKFNGYKVYITNGEPWSELGEIEPIGKLWPDKSGTMSGDFLRGGTTENFLWIDEQMICKTGVKTRNDAGTPDNEVRSLDQVVHEFGHAIVYRYKLDGVVISSFKGDHERFPWAVQYWFGTPAGNLDPRAAAVMTEIFSTKVGLKCVGYKP